MTELPGFGVPGGGDIDVNRLHDRDDLDVTFLSHHHTLGKLPTQASPGDHIHNGKTSSNLLDTYIGPLNYKQFLQPNLGDFATVGFTDWLTGIVIPASGNLPKWAQDGTAKVDIVIFLTAMYITAVSDFQYRLVTFATNGPISEGQCAAVTERNLQLVGQTITIPAGTTSVTTKVQANKISAGGAIRFSSASNAFALVDATIRK